MLIILTLPSNRPVHAWQALELQEPRISCGYDQVYCCGTPVTCDPCFSGNASPGYGRKHAVANLCALRKMLFATDFHHPMNSCIYAPWSCLLYLTIRLNLVMMFSVRFFSVLRFLHCVVLPLSLQFLVSCPILSLLIYVAQAVRHRPLTVAAQVWCRVKSGEICGW
jgi:hypothetical protein